MMILLRRPMYTDTADNDKNDESDNDCIEDIDNMMIIR